MKRTTALLTAIIFCTIGSAYAMDSLIGKGTWPKSWPEELEPLRKQSRTIMSGLVGAAHYEIPFTTREEFESAWPHLLKVKSKGAPIILVSGPHEDFGETIKAGVRVWGAIQKENRDEPAVPIPGQSHVRARWASTTFIEIVVDGEIVDLNRIPLPADAPIIDERFKVGEKKLLRMTTRRSALWIVVAGSFLNCGCGQTPREQTSNAVAQKSLGWAAGIGDVPPGSGALEATAAKRPPVLATSQQVEMTIVMEDLPRADSCSTTNSGTDESDSENTRQPGAARKPAQAEAPAPLPDIRLTGDEVTPEAIAKLADRAWGTVTLAAARFNGAIIERLRHVPSIRTLRLFGDGLSGQIPRLGTVQGLVGLEIEAPLKGRDLEAIGRLPNLERLSLPQELTINVSGAREIAKLVQLKSLRLYNVNIDDAAFVELRTLVRLEELDLTHTSITDAGLTTVVQMPLLRTLELYRHPNWHTSQQLSDACLASIARLPELEQLSLSGKVTDAGLKQVARWPKLKSLSILSTEITGNGLAALADASIEHLTLASGQISEEPLKKCRNLKSVMVIGQPRGDESKWPLLLPNLDWSFSS